MIEHIEDLDQAVEFVLEKATANNRAHIMAATMTQDDHDKHADALAHHASAIKYYREKPEVKKALEQIAALVPHRSYINKPLKLDQVHAPQISVDDLNKEHPALKGRADHEAIAKAINANLSSAHKAFHSNPDLKALNSHSKRFLAHLSAMLEWHNLQKKGEGAHHQFAGHISGPELEDNHANSKYRGHSTPSATDRTKFRTQSITKAGGAKWHPGLPELTSLEEAAGHPSAGKMKELYPFEQIKVNNEPLKMREFGEKAPEEIHDQDYATNLTRDHKVKTPDGQIVDAMGGYHGSKSAGQNMEHMSRVGVFKKSAESEVSSYFPQASVAHIVLARNLIEVLNPYAAMTDEEFGDYVVSSMSKSLGPSEQASIIAESQMRLEKAARGASGRAPKATATSDNRLADEAHSKGVSDVLGGKVTPLPLTEASERTTKEGERRDELKDIAQASGRTMRRSPFAVPKEIFTDDTYSKVDPEKYKQYVNGEMNEQDHRNQLATYQQVIRHNPEAQKRHRDYVDSHRQMVRESLGQTARGEETATPVVEQRQSLAEAGKLLQAGKITPQEFASMSAQAGKQRAQNVGHKASEAEMTDDEKAIKEQDPSYRPSRPSAAGKAQDKSEKDLTDIAHGKIPSHMLGDKGDMGNFDENHGDAQAKDMIGSKGEEGDGVVGGSVSSAPSPIQLINEHPGFKAYLKMKEHLLSHYKNPAVRKYMEEKLNAHENNPNLDVGKLASTMHFLHRSHNQAQNVAQGQGKMLQDVLSGPESEAGADEGDVGETGKGNANSPESMMTPEQIERLNAARKDKEAQSSAPTPPAADPARTTGLKTSDPEYKKKLMAEIQARENAKKPK